MEGPTRRGSKGGVGGWNAKIQQGGHGRLAYSNHREAGVKDYLQWLLDRFFYQRRISTLTGTCCESFPCKQQRTAGLTGLGFENTCS
jgi:hypothetical protein